MNNKDEWEEFWERNSHLFLKEFYGIKLKPYQIVLLMLYSKYWDIKCRLMRFKFYQ